MMLEYLESLRNKKVKRVFFDSIHLGDGRFFIELEDGKRLVIEWVGGLVIIAGVERT